ncbi:MAG: response regulator, partial [Leptospiraceae bacterium]|nr:response regulator [Leptospiraceae bacterium]
MIRVFIVDDSAVVRQTLTEILSDVSDIEVVGTASDPIFARTKLESGWPDVIILDIEMPRMDGLTFLGHIMQEHPTPVIICSSLTTEGAKWTLDALATGAVEVIAKPEHGLKNFLEEYRENLVRAIRSAAASGNSIHRITRLTSPKTSELVSRVHESEVYPGIKATSPPADKTFRRASERIVVLGASAGGANAIEVILRQLPADCPGIAIVQHMPEKFTDAFARRLDSLC